MIQEKDFLYRVPVKTAPITTPRGQIRNPEILVDLEGGEFMHGNILDANSTNKLINQSVKDAVDNKVIESGYVTKDLLDAETTRATEQENSLKTLIGAETSARTKSDEGLSAKIQTEQTRAEGKEKEISDKLAYVYGDLRDGINKVQQKVTANTTAIEGKQDKGNYIEYSSKNDDGYTIDCELNTSEPITVDGGSGYLSYVTQSGIEAHDSSGRQSNLNATSLSITSSATIRTIYTVNGITTTQYNDCLATSDGTFKPISDFVLSSAYNEKIAELEARIAALEAKHPEAAA